MGDRKYKYHFTYYLSYSCKTYQLIVTEILCQNQERSCATVS